MLAPVTIRTRMAEVLTRLASVLGLIGLLISSSTAKAADPPKKTKIFFDRTEGRFNAPLRGGADRELEVFTILPKASTARFEYWPQTEEECPSEAHPYLGKPGADQATLTDAEKSALEKVRWPGQVDRSALPAQDEPDGKQRYIAHIGPLRLNVHYCFRLVGEETLPLKEGQKRRFSQAVVGAIRAAAQSTRHADPPTTACAVEEAEAPPLTQCEVVAAFKEAKPAALNFEVSYDGGKPVVPHLAFEQALQDQVAFSEALMDTIARLVGVSPSYKSYGGARTELGTLPAGTYAYDPLPSLTSADLQRAAPPALRATYRAHARDIATRAEIRATLWSDRKAFYREQANWSRLSPQKRGELRAFLEYQGKLRTEEPKAISITPSMRNELLASAPVLTGSEAWPGSTAKAALAAVKKATGSYRPIATLRTWPRWSTSGPATTDIEAFLSAASVLQLSAQEISRAEKALEDLIRPGADGKLPAGFDAFLTKFKSVKRTQAIDRFVWEATYEERFPLYASADVGLAGAILPVRGTGPGQRDRFEVVPYFGVNLYFTAIDKDEPLSGSVGRGQETRGRNTLRRFGLVAGMSLYRPSLNRDLGVVGVLGNQVLLFGAGFRIVDHVRVGSGAFIYKQISPNPLSTKASVRAAPYFSISLDVDVIGTVRGWFNDARTNTL